jgi:Uma2 family endonuclease
VREYWVVDPLDKSVEVYTGKGGSFTLVQQAEKEGMIRSGVLEGFAVEVQEIFVDIP